MDYELSRLNPRTFEHLIQGVGARVLGPGLVIFGDGPDGGREAAIDAKVPYPTPVEQWSGRIVLQAKFLQRPKSTGDDGQWALSALQDELDAYANPETSRELPDFLILATNVTLSPVKDAGAKDKMIEMAASSGLKGFDVWDYDKLRVWLDGFEDLRRSFAAYILPGDVIAETIDALSALGDEQPGFDDSIGRFLQKELLADQWANLEQAGRAADEQVPVSRVFVDLPFATVRQADPPLEEPGGLAPGIVAHLIEASSQRLDPKTLGSQQNVRLAVDGSARGPSAGRLVVLGGPGQGKSTIGQFVCQMFRAALLRSRPTESLSTDVHDALGVLEEHCRSDGLELPAVKRFPLRVELNKFAEALNSTDGANSLIEYLAAMISARIPGEVTPTLMSKWLGSYPWLLVLDGLDEVPASRNREELMAAIREFWIDTSQDNADCLVIATTRPQGYDDEFSPDYYNHLWLAPLSTPRAMHYAERLLGARILDDDERRETVRTRVERAASRPDTARLMTSPLQVTIMATLLERMGQPPEGRWNLFSQYYRVIYDRELERDIPAASVLRDYKPDIDAIHRRVGLLLQVESESARGVEAQMPRSRFAEVVKARLREEEHDFTGNEALVSQIIDTAMERLVFLVGVEAGQVGFEIRSLQEFMAAEAMLDGGDEIVVERLRAIAPLPAWRNVFLFAAGRCFADLQHLRMLVPTICAELNDPANDPLSQLALPGSSLAIDLLADGVAHRQPRYERLLGREALRILRRAPGSLNDQLAEIYLPVHEENFKAELRNALGVEAFTDALAAWRTLAVLATRDQPWAIELIEGRLPGSGELADVFEALPPEVTSPALGELLARLSIAAPPFESFPYDVKVESLGVLEAAPDWYQAAFSLVHEGKGSKKIHYADWQAGEPLFEVRPVEAGDGPFRRAVECFDAAGADELPRSWQPLVEVVAFGKAPSSEALARQLERLAELEEEDLNRYSIYTAWPLTALLSSNMSRDDLINYSERARAGDLGDLADWVAAEERWHERPVAEVDLRHPTGGEWPFDSEVASVGFPLGAATVTASEDRREMATLVLRWLELVRHPPARRFAAHLVFWLLGGRIVDRGTPRVSGLSVARIIGAEDLLMNFHLNFEALEELEWGSTLSQEEIDLLEALGEGFQGFSPELSALGPDLADAILAAWRDDRERQGLYRLLAAGLPRGAYDGPTAAALLDPGDGDHDRNAHALLTIKLTLRADAATLAQLATAPDPWLTAAIQTIGQLPDETEIASALATLDTLLEPKRWQRRRELDNIAAELISRRSSQLADAQAWSSLKLFERPAES